jgi:hypothetical protein
MTDAVNQPLAGMAMIRNMRGMICTVSGTSNRTHAGRRHKFARLQRRPPEP